MRILDIWKFLLIIYIRFSPFHSWNIFQGERWDGDGDYGYDLITARGAGTPTFVVHALQTFLNIIFGIPILWDIRANL